MAKVKREFTGVFIPAHIWTNKDLTPAEKMLLGEIDALSKNLGWCDAGREHFSEWLQCDVTNVTYYLKKLERLGFIEILRQPGYASRLRVIQERFRIEQVVNPVHGGSESSSRGVVNPVHGGSESSSREIKDKYKSKIKEEIQEAPQAAFITTHTPDQIENLEVRIVEGREISLETEKNEEGKVPPPAENETDTVVIIYRPPQETPALQSAGNFEANPTPQLLDLEAQSRDEQVFAAIEGKKTRTPKPAGNSTAAICAELKTQEVLDFFHAIHAAWGEWIDYKRREKKGTYKTAKSEAATITELANEVNCDAEAARAAIRRSIAKTYIGICPDKNWKSATLPARYSLEDRPQAQTPAQMKEELGRFYTGHKDLLAEVQQTAETNYGQERLRSIVTDFCANRIGKGRQNETFGQHHAELGNWLKRQKEFDAKNNPSNQQHGPQPQAQLRSVAPVNYSQQGPPLRSEQKAE
jgi:hypothetical protein